jgi:outer membrane protein insertion porin family
LICAKIDEGKQYRLGTIRIKGARVFSTTEIRNMLNLREGDVADGAAIHKWQRDDLEKAYYDLGYLDFYADEEHEPRKTPTGEMTDVVDFNITINEGTRYRVASIAVEGKTEIRKAQLSAALRLREGAIFLQKQLDDSIRELNKLGLALEQDMDVAVLPERRSESVRIVIVLDKGRRPDDSFNRFVMKRRWYL